MDDFVQLNVGGIPYFIARCHIEKFPESFFACLIKKEWSAENDQPVCIERDGVVFQFVYAYLINGSLPRRPALGPEIIERLKVEADFYGLTDLVLHCNRYSKPSTEVDMPNYLLMQKFVENFTSDEGSSHELTVQYNSELIQALKPLSVPSCLVGRVDEVDTITSTYLYTAVVFARIGASIRKQRGVLEILAPKIVTHMKRICDLITLDTFAPEKILTVRPVKLVIHREGCSQELGPVLPANREEGHVGTLVVILNSEYTGGELEVTHGGRTEVVTGPHSWVAMYGDCLHKINPVTSGTRVSLIYDIYGSTPENTRYTHTEEDLQDEICDVWTQLYDMKYFPDGERFGVNGVTLREKERILDCLDAELVNSGPDGVIIALQKLYPEYQNVDPSSLQDADRVLYDMLTGSASNPPWSSSWHEQYDVQIVTVIIHRTQEETYVEGDTTRCMLFSAKAVRRELATDTDVEFAEEDENEEVELDAKVLLPYPLDVTGMLDYREEKDEDRSVEEFVFIATCLHVRKMST